MCTPCKHVIELSSPWNGHVAMQVYYVNYDYADHESMHIYNYVCS